MNKCAMFVCSDPNDYPTIMPLLKDLTYDLKCIVFYDSVKWNAKNPKEEYLEISIITEGCNLNKVIKTYKPGIIVLANDTSIFCRAVIYCANQFEIPTILIPHGLQGRYPRDKYKVLKTWLKVLKPKELLKGCAICLRSGLMIKMLKAAAQTLKAGYSMGHGECVRICCVGQDQKINLIQQGVVPEKLIVTGNPRFDLILHEMKKETSSLIKNQLSNGNKVITIISEARIEQHLWSLHQHIYWIKTALEAIYSVSNATPIIKLHPQEDKDYHENLLKELGYSKVKLIKNEISLYDVIKASDVCIALYSTAIVEAMCFGKPIILLSLFNEPDSMGFIEKNVVYHATSKEELIKTVSCIIKDEIDFEELKKRQLNFAKEKINFGGNATENVINVIKGLL